MDSVYLGGMGCCTKCTGHQKYFIVCALILALQWEMTMESGWLPMTSFTPTENTDDGMEREMRKLLLYYGEL